MKKLLSVSLLTCMLSVPALAQVDLQVDAPWVRATVPQQRSTGMFARLTSPVDAKLVGASSPAATTTEVHEMKMEKDVMKMRAVEALPLPAGQAVELKPGGYHIMLLDLKAQAKEGDTIPLRLEIETADGQRSTVDVQAPVRALTAKAGHGEQKPQAGHQH